MSRAANILGTERARGWTLIELVVVITVLGIVAAMAAPRGVDRAAFAARGYAAELASAARLAHTMATASGCPVRLQIDAVGYRALRTAAAGTHCSNGATGFPNSAARADGTPLRGVMPVGVALASNTQWTFNADSTVTVQGSSAAAIGAQAISVNSATGIVSGP